MTPSSQEFDLSPESEFRLTDGIMIVGSNPGVFDRPTGDAVERTAKSAQKGTDLITIPGPLSKTSFLLVFNSSTETLTFIPVSASNHVRFSNNSGELVETVLFQPTSIPLNELHTILVDGSDQQRLYTLKPTSRPISPYRDTLVYSLRVQPFGSTR